MLRKICIFGFLAGCCLVLLAACGENMRDNARLQPYEPNTFYPDGQSNQPVISGTVALGMLHVDDPLYSGQAGGQLVAAFPLTVTRAVLARGQERYNIYCAPCHGLVGDGQGMIVARGFSPPPTFHQQRLRDAPVGHFFDVITNGYGQMYSYADRVVPEDRWAIIAYIRALQLSQNATAADLTAAERQNPQAQVSAGASQPSKGHLMRHSAIDTATLPAALRRVQLPALAVGLVGLVACAAGAVLDPGTFFPSYLFAFIFWLGVALGSLAIQMLYHLVGGGWGLPIRRIQEAAAMTLPLLMLLFVPLLFGLGWLYAWARPAAVAADPLLLHKSVYLNPTFYTIRAAVYFAIWIGMASLLNRWSLEQDRTGDPMLAERMRNLSRFGLIVYILTLTFASIDWVQSTEAHWYSTIYGLIYLAGQGLSGFSFAIIIAALLSEHEPLADAATPARFGDLGGLLLVFVMFWAYTALSQFLLIWSGNLPDEVTWYVQRGQGGWNWIIIVVIALQFFLPFMLLLARRVKQTIPALAGVAGLILIVHLLDLFWLVVPPFRPEGLSIHWVDLAAPLGIGGVWLAAFIWLLGRRPLLPLHDPRSLMLQEATDHG